MTQRPRAEGRRTIQPSLGTSLALPLGAGGSGIVEAFATRFRDPKRRRAAPEGSTTLRGELGDTSRTTTLRARLGGYRLNFSSSPKATARAPLVAFPLSLSDARKTDTPTASLRSTTPTRRKPPSNKPPNRPAPNPARADSRRSRKGKVCPLGTQIAYTIRKVSTESARLRRRGWNCHLVSPRLRRSSIWSKVRLCCVKWKGDNVQG